MKFTATKQFYFRRYCRLFVIFGHVENFELGSFLNVNFNRKETAYVIDSTEFSDYFLFLYPI
jgi:hypothetical protein